MNITHRGFSGPLEYEDGFYTIKGCRKGLASKRHPYAANTTMVGAIEDYKSMVDLIIEAEESA